MGRLAGAMVTSSAVAALAYAASSRLPATVRAPWVRRNHAGAEVTLLEGPAHVVALASGAIWASSVTGWGPAVAALGAGALGALDDLAGDSRSKGLRGHLTAAAHGRITTGFVKVIGLGALGVFVAAIQDRRAGTLAAIRNDTDRGGRRERAGVAATTADGGAAVDALLGGAVIAGSANLVNLFDLRPGRALKVGIVASLPLVAGRASGSIAAASALGACVGVLRPDLRGEAMLGDTGANALGAVLGAALVDGAPRRRRTGVLLALGALTLLSEKVSFTQVIESTPGLRELDGWGRPPR